MDLIDFLRARIDEDEAMARAAASEGADPATSNDGTYWVVNHGGYGGPLRVARPGEHKYDANANAVSKLVVTHDPARVLREVEAKRRIIERHKPGEEFEPEPDMPWIGARSCLHCFEPWPCPDVKDARSSYADHPEYDASWRP